MRPIRPIILAAVIFAAGCSTSSPSPTPGPSTGLGSPEAVDTTWPPGCETIDLRAPDGSPVGLTGTWIDESRDDAGRMTWHILTQGDCFYGTGSVDDVIEEGQFKVPISVQMFIGTIRSDYTIDGSMLHVGPRSVGLGTIESYAPVRLLIDFPDEGGIQLLEDRVAGEIDPPRCPDPLFCLPPMRLVPR